MDSQTRQEYVRAAVSYLQNPNLIDCSLSDKLKFLKDKGLSQVEVDEALNLALINRHQNQSGRWNFFLILGLCVGGYKLYQAYVESKMRLTEESTERVSKVKTSKPVEIKTSFYPKPKDPNADLTLGDILDKVIELKNLMEMQRCNMQTEIESIKTLLLGPGKFTDLPVTPNWLTDDNTLTGEASTTSKAIDETSAICNRDEKQDQVLKEDDKARKVGDNKKRDKAHKDDRAQKDDKKKQERGPMKVFKDV